MHQNDNAFTISTPLVLLPGFMLDESLWDDLINQIGHCVPIYCLPLGPGTTIKSIAEKIANSAPLRFILVGFSLGGYVARKVAELYPDRVSALILVATSLRVDTDVQEISKRNAVAAINADNFRGLSPSSIASSLHPAKCNDKTLIAKIKNMGKRLGYTSFVAQMSLQRDQIAASTLLCPTLVIAAAEDPLRSTEEAMELATAIPNATLKTIENSGHMIPLEQPKVLAEVISQWISGQ